MYIEPYSDKEEKIVCSGMKAINLVIKEGSDDEIMRLLNCLDKYLDPYYGFNLSYADDIFQELHNIIDGSNSLEIKEEAQHLVESYEPLP